MNSHYVISLIIAIPMMLAGLASSWLQTRGLRTLYSRKLVPSDEFHYLRNKYRRRFAVGLLLVLIGGMLGGAFVSGMEATADRLAAKQPTDADGKKRELTPEQRDFLRWYGVYWLVVVSLVFVMIGFALTDGWATRRYWLSQYRQLRDDHNAKMRRDIAIMKAQQDQRGSNPGYGGRLGQGNES